MADASKFNAVHTDAYASEPDATNTEWIIVMLCTLMTTCWLLILPFSLCDLLIVDYLNTADADATKPNAEASLCAPFSNDDLLFSL